MVKAEQVQQIVIVKLGNPKNLNQDLLNVCYDEALERVKNYCSIDRIPLGLIQTLSNIIRDLYLFYNSFYVNEEQQGEGTSTGTISVESVDSVKMGDVTISLKDDAVTKKPANERDYSSQHNYNIDQIVETYSDMLNEYRRLVW